MISIVLLSHDDRKYRRRTHLYDARAGFALFIRTEGGVYERQAGNPGDEIRRDHVLLRK